MKKWERILYGGDYNPNQWPRDVWKEDMRLFKKANINSATVNVFSWAKLQPSEETYDFSELDDIIEMLSRENCEIVLATSTAALPAWMVKRYPEVSRTDYHGIRNTGLPHKVVAAMVIPGDKYRNMVLTSDGRDKRVCNGSLLLLQSKSR